MRSHPLFPLDYVWDGDISFLNADYDANLMEIEVDNNVFVPLDDRFDLGEFDTLTTWGVFNFTRGVSVNPH